MISCVNVVGARPNFMKMAPLHRAMAASDAFATCLVHTGQHYDVSMSDVFFRDLGLQEPDVDLDVGSGTHSEQTARAMVGLERVLTDVSPDLVVVVGDVNSTLAGALTAAKLRIPVAHVEAGLRSYDRTMPEEINRVVADVLSDLLFAPSSDAVENLRREGIPDERIHLVGNIMIDSLEACLERPAASMILEDLALEPREYFLTTLHRPSNVDDPEALAAVVRILSQVRRLLPTVLVAHPRTSRRLTGTRSMQRLVANGVRVIEPLGYLDFLKLLAHASAVLTDSGGIQEEATVLGIPCITLRDRTERPITVTQGTNRVTGLDLDAILEAARDALSGGAKPSRPPLWDGHTAQRIVDVLLRSLDHS